MHLGSLILLVNVLLLGGLVLCRKGKYQRYKQYSTTLEIVQKRLEKLERAQGRLYKRRCYFDSLCDATEGYCKPRSHQVTGSCQRFVCPTGYSQIKKSCLLFVMGQDSARPWHQAKEYCQAMGSNLVTISSHKQLRFVERYLGENFNHSRMEIFTGLIATNYKAEKPYDPLTFQEDHYIWVKDSYRWTATKEAVKLEGKRDPLEPVASFHPVIQGPEVSDSLGHLSCIVLDWDPHRKRHEKLVFVFGKCQNKRRFICEVRPPRRRCATPYS